MGNTSSLPKEEPISLERFKNAVFGLVLLRFAQDIDPQLTFEDIDKCVDSYCLPHMELGKDDSDFSPYFNYYGTAGPGGTQSAMDAAIERYVEAHLVNDKKHYGKFFSHLLDTFYPKDSLLGATDPPRAVNGSDPEGPEQVNLSDSKEEAAPDSGKVADNLLEKNQGKTGLAGSSAEQLLDRVTYEQPEAQLEDAESAITEGMEFKGKCQISEAGSLAPLIFPTKENQVQRKKVVKNALTPPNFEASPYMMQSSLTSDRSRRTGRSSANIYRVNQALRSRGIAMAHRRPVQQMEPETDLIKESLGNTNNEDQQGVKSTDMELAEQDRPDDQQKQQEEQDQQMQQEQQEEQYQQEQEQHEQHEQHEQQEEQDQQMQQEKQQYRADEQKDQQERQQDRADEQKEQHNEAETKENDKINEERLLRERRRKVLKLDRLLERTGRSHLEHEDYVSEPVPPAPSTRNKEIAERANKYRDFDFENSKSRTSNKFSDFKKSNGRRNERVDEPDNLELSLDSEFPPSEVRTPYNIYDYDEEELRSEAFP
jgi:hypothetical protein